MIDVYEKEHVSRLRILDIGQVILSVFGWNRQRLSVLHDNPAPRKNPHASCRELKHITLLRRILKRNQTRLSPALRLCHMTKAGTARCTSIAQNDHVF